MIRVLVDQPLAADHGRIALSTEERHHLSVRRVEPGTEVEVLDGRGRIGTGRLEADGSVTLDRVASVEPLSPLTLLVGAGDKDRFAWLVEKAVELGVTTLIPVETERSLQVATRVRATHRERLEKRAHEALKQCGGAWHLAIRSPQSLADALSGCETGQRWLADPAGRPPPSAGAAEPTTVLIGPEGGLTPVETRLAADHGFVATRLGVRTMRFETAAIAAAALARISGRER